MKPFFDPFTEWNGTIGDAIEKCGHVAFCTYSSLKTKVRVCYTLEEVEEELAAIPHIKRIARQRYVSIETKVFADFVWPDRDKIGTASKAEQFCVIRYNFVDYGHDFSPNKWEWYPSRTPGVGSPESANWNRSISNIGVRAVYLSQNDPRVGYNRDYGLFILAREEGGWVWPNNAQLEQAYRSISAAHIDPVEAIQYFDPTPLQFFTTKEKAVERLFPYCRIGYR